MYKEKNQWHIRILFTELWSYFISVFIYWL